MCVCVSVCVCTVDTIHYGGQNKVKHKMFVLLKPLLNHHFGLGKVSNFEPNSQFIGTLMET